MAKTNGQNLFLKRVNMRILQNKYRTQYQLYDKDILVILFMLGWTFAVAGYINYQLISQTQNPISLFFAELGLLIPLFYINFKVAIKIGGSNDIGAIFMGIAAAVAMITEVNPLSNSLLFLAALASWLVAVVFVIMALIDEGYK